MVKKSLLHSVLAIFLIASAIAPSAVSARGVRRVLSEPVIPQAHAAELLASDKTTAEKVESATDETPVSCDYTKPEKPVYTGQFIAVRKKGVMAKNEVFETKVYINNTGNVPWFSASSGCAGPIAKLGTEKQRDRVSVFFTDDLFWKSNWDGPNRIQMQTKRVDPGQLATFTFWSKAPDKDGLYREYFDVVLEGVTWMDGALFSTDIKVGEPNVVPEKRDLLQYITESVNLADINLEGDKSIEVDLSEQRMYLKIGEYVIRKFPVSTGKAATPTPVGTTKILEKREVRVAAGTPHWIMPKWMMFRKGGYGIHALPSLANDGGVYWREALNHIGTPRSHGCIRLLPKDAEFTYNFGEVGMTVVVRR
jgi:hypothetical protein